MTTPPLYVTGAVPRSSKSILSLGLMEILAAAGRRVGFFRPVVVDERDPMLQLIHSRYPLGLPIHLLYGCSAAEARQLAAEGDVNALFKRILARYKSVEAHFDLMVCEGTDSSISIAGLEFDFNIELANTLGALLLPVLSGFRRSATDLVDDLRLLQRTLAERDCQLLALAVNRVAAEQRPLLEQQLATQQQEGDPPIYLLADHPVLAMPTVGEIATALNARLLAGDEAGLTREVAAYKVAAMELPHFLDHLSAGSLIITPGDRADIIAGSLLAHASSHYPAVAGLLLTGGLAPAPQVLRLIDGLSRTPVPLLTVESDTFATATAVNSIEATLGTGNPRKLAAALAVVEQGIDAVRLRERLVLPRQSRVTPLMFEYELIQRAKRIPQRIVLPEGHDDRILRAAEILRLREVAEITLLGNPAQIRARIAALDLRLEGVSVVDPTHSPDRERYAEALYHARSHKGITRQMAWDMVEDISYFGTLMVHTGVVDGMVSGALNTTQHTIRPAFQVIRTRPGHNLISSVFLMSLPDRVLVYGDCAVNPDPTAAELADIAIASAETAARFSIEPRVAMLSYSTGSSGKGEAVEKVREAVRIARERAPHLPIEGPIQYDAAVDSSVARTKLPESEVAGRATVFIFPDLNTGNNTYKAVQRSSGAVAIGPILQGLNKPVNDLSRGCTVTDIVNTVAITAIQAQDGQ